MREQSEAQQLIYCSGMLPGLESTAELAESTLFIATKLDCVLKSWTSGQHIPHGGKMKVAKHPK